MFSVEQQVLLSSDEMPEHTDPKSGAASHISFKCTNVLLQERPNHVCRDLCGLDNVPHFFFLVTRSRPGFHKTKARSGPLPEALICSHSSREFSFQAPFPDKPQLLHGDTTSLWSPSEWARFYCKHLLPQLPPFSYGHAHSPWELVLCHYNSHFPALQVYLLFLPSSCFCSFIFELSHCVRCTTERFNAYGVVRWWALWVGLWFSSVRLFHYFL